MYFVLPDAKDGLPALLEKVSSESGFLERHLPNEPVEVGEFRIPRFKISFGFEASEVLKGLGLVLPFLVKEGRFDWRFCSSGMSSILLKADKSSIVLVQSSSLRAEICCQLSKNGSPSIDKKPDDAGLSLTKHVLQTKAKDSNLIFSPLPLHVVLSVIAAGSKGRLLEQLLFFLDSKSIHQLNSFSLELFSLVFADGSPIGGPSL
ncbi:hypothetical protein CRYUN_Cryun35bG0027200 [Craigia yunnanensis]